MEPTEGSETSDFENWTPGRYPKEANLHSRHGESLRTKINTFPFVCGLEIIILWVCRLEVSQFSSACSALYVARMKVF